MFSYRGKQINWKKSSLCSANGTCVEVANLAPDTMGIRDSKAGPQSPILTMTAHQWRNLATQIKTQS